MGPGTRGAYERGPWEWTCGLAPWALPPVCCISWPQQQVGFMSPDWSALAERVTWISAPQFVHAYTWPAMKDTGHLFRAVSVEVGAPSLATVLGAGFRCRLPRGLVVTRS